MNVVVDRVDELLARTNIKDILDIFPETSYKYGSLIPSIALLIDNRYTIKEETRSLSVYDKMFLENIVHCVNNKSILSVYKPIDYGVYAKMLNHPEGEGFQLYYQYVLNKRYSTLRFNSNGNIISVNVTKDSLHRSIIDICNIIGIKDNGITEFHQILAACRIMMH